MSVELVVRLEMTQLIQRLALALRIEHSLKLEQALKLELTWGLMRAGSGVSSNFGSGVHLD